MAEEIHSSKSRGLGAEMATRFMRGIGTGAVGLARFPDLSLQWLGEQAVTSVPQGLYWLLGGKSTLGGAVRHFGTESQWDAAARKRTEDMLTQHYLGDRTRAQAIVDMAYRGNNPEYRAADGSTGNWFRSMDAQLSAVGDAMDHFDFMRRGSLATHSDTDAELIGTAGALGEVVGGGGPMGLLKGGVREGLTAAGKAAKEWMGKSTMGKAGAALKGAAVAGSPAGLMVAGGLTTSPINDGGTPKTREQIASDAHDRALIAGLIGTGTLLGLKGLRRPMEMIYEGSINRLAQKAKSDKRFKDALNEMQTKDVDKWMEDHLDPTDNAKYLNIKAAADRLGLELAPLFMTGEAGPRIARVMLQHNPALFRDELHRAIKKLDVEVAAMTGRPAIAPTAAMTARQAALRPDRARKGAPAQVTVAWDRLAERLRSHYGELMRGFARQYQKLDERAQDIAISHEGLDLPSKLQNDLTQFDTLFHDNRHLSNAIARIRSVQMAAETDGRDFVMTARDVQDLRLAFREIKRATPKGQYRVRYELEQALDELNRRVREADPELHRAYTDLNARYSNTIGQRFRSDRHSGSNLAETVIGSDKVSGTDLLEKVFTRDSASGGVLINRSAFRDLHAAMGNNPDLVNAMTTRIAYGLVDAGSNKLSLKKFARFMDDNHEILSNDQLYGGTGRSIKEGLSRQLDIHFHKMLGGPGDDAMAGFAGDADTVLDAMRNPEQMDHLVAAIRRLPSKDAEAGMDALRWSVGNRIAHEKQPHQFMAAHPQAFERLYTAEENRTLKDLALVKENYEEWHKQAHSATGGYRSLLTGKTTMFESVQKAVMEHVGWTLSTLLANMKMVFGIRIRGTPYALGQQAQIQLSLLNMRRVTEMLLSSAAESPEKMGVVRRLMDPELGRDKLSRRFANMVFQLMRPAMYDEPDGHLSAHDREVMRYDEQAQFPRWQAIPAQGAPAQ